MLRSVDDFDRLRGTNLAWFGLDELTYTQEGAWLRLEGRLRDPKATRLCGFAVWTPKGFDWVYRKFISEPVAGYEAIQAQPFENRFLLDRVPDFYDRLKASYDENFFRQEVLGDYLNVQAGLVYPAFRREQNVREWRSIRRCDFLDAGFQCGSAVFAGGRRSAGTKCGCWTKSCCKRATTEQACEEFETKFGMPRAGVVVLGTRTGATMHTASDTDGLSGDSGLFRDARVARRT